LSLRSVASVIQLDVYPCRSLNPPDADIAGIEVIVKAGTNRSFSRTSPHYRTITPKCLTLIAYTTRKFSEERAMAELGDLEAVDRLEDYRTHR
jgi:hypothetical protein